MSVISQIKVVWRNVVVLILLFTGLCVLAAQAVFNSQNVYLKKKSKNVTARHLTLSAPRGTIFDSQGNIIAIDVLFYQYLIDGRRLNEKWKNLYEKSAGKFNSASYLNKNIVKDEVLKLSKVLGVSYDKFNRLLVKATSKRRTLFISKKVTLEEHLNFQEIGSKVSKKLISSLYESITSKGYYRRRYPHKNVFSELVGHMPISKEREPFDGVERALDNRLRGKNGGLSYLKNLKGDFVELKQGVELPKAGKDVQLTVDYQLQYILNKELYKQLHIHRAKSASALLVEVKTGEIKALVSQPNYNPNNTLERTAYRTRLRPLLDYIEPGSVQKSLLVAAGLESAILSEDSTVRITRKSKFKWRSTPFIEERALGVRTVSEVMKYSLNSGIIKFAENIPREHFWALYNRLGYGAKHNIFTGERGISSLPHHNSWIDSDYYTRTYGYSEKINIFNIISFYVAIANNGILPPLHLLPQEEDKIIRKSRRIVSTQTAIVMKKILHQVTTSNGTGRKAQIRGIKVAGKTGTARKGAVLQLKYRALFVGFAPLENPRYALAIIVENPRRNEEFYSGGTVAAPLFSTVMKQILHLDLSQNVASN
jgi:cell division protein FtsI (penicillin-binding protein 3)